MSGRLIAIGDIHGCLVALESVLAAIEPRPEDTIVALGDYVDRGPDSKGVIDCLIGLGKRCNFIAIYGNHEEMMLQVVRDGQPPYHWLQYGGVDTLDSYGFCGDMSVIPSDHMRFFSQMRNFYETETHFFVHANYDPELPLDQQSKQFLRWLKLSDFTPSPHQSGKQAVVGHTPDVEIFDIGHLVCIDTHCYGGGWLTALEVHSGTIWQASIEGELRS